MIFTNADDVKFMKSLSNLIISGFITISIFLGSWALKGVADCKVEVAKLSVEVAEIKKVQLTKLDDIKTLLIAIGELKERIAKIPTEQPPIWLLDLIKDLTKRLEKIDEKLSSHMEKDKI